MSNKLKPLCVAALLCVSAAANADITVYTSAADFLSAVPAPTIDTFDDLGQQAFGNTLTRNAGDWTYQVSSPGGLYGAGRPGDTWLRAGSATSAIVFTNFSGGVSAFGGNFFASNAAGFLPQGNLVITASDGSMLTYNLSRATQYSFVGFTSDVPLTSVTLEGAPGGDSWPTASAVVLAAVPEPATYGMFLAGLGFLGVMARRRG